MTGPDRVADTIRELMGELMKGTSRPDQIIAAAQVLATLELADAVRSTRVELEQIPGTVLSTDETMSEAVANQLRTWTVGDEDPTSSEGPWCPAGHVDGEGDWVCTWPPGHRGKHVAGDGSEVCAVWA